MNTKNAATPVAPRRIIGVFRIVVIALVISFSLALLSLSSFSTLNDSFRRRPLYPAPSNTDKEVQQKLEEVWAKVLNEASAQLDSRQEDKQHTVSDIEPRPIEKRKGLFSRGFLDGLLGGGGSSSSTSQGGGGILGGLLDGLGGGGGASKGNTSASPAGGGGLLGGLLGGGGGNGASTGGGGIEGIITGVASSLISQAVQGQGPLGGIFSGLADAAGPAANALGTGLGMGTIKGLKLQSMMNTPMTQPNATGFSGLAMNLGEGLSSSIFSNLNTSSIASPDTINQAAGSLGSGLGNGTASVLAPNKARSIMPPTGTGTVGAAGNLGFGLSSGLFGNIDLTGLQSSGAFAQLSKILGPAGKGLGEGAAQALGMGNGQTSSLASRSPTSAAFNNTIGASGFDIAQASEDFTKSLSSSFLQNMNISALMSPQSQQTIMDTISSAAGPAGKGLGTGGAAGLARLLQAMSGNTANPSTPMTNPPPSSADSNHSTIVSNKESKVVLHARLNRLARDLPSSQAPPMTSSSNSAPQSIGAITNDFTMNLAENFVGNLNVSGVTSPKMQQQLIDTLASAAPGAGRGLGAGAAQGLGYSNATGPYVSPSKDTSGIAEGFSHELSSSFLSGARTSVQSSFNKTQLLAMIASAAPAAGRGLGSGTARGLGLSNVTNPPINPGSTDTSGIAQGFTDGLSSSFITNSNIKLGSGINQTQILSLLATAAPRAGKGLGSGAAQGLGLSNNTAVMVNPNNPSTGDVTEGFTHELSSSFISNADLANIAKKAIDTSTGSTNMIADVAEGLGKGIGGGTAVGLGLQPDSSDPVADASASSIAQTFGHGLTSSFLANGTVGKLESSATQTVTSMAASLNISNEAECLVLFLAEGVGGALSPTSDMGGSSPDTMQEQFNDTVGGAAVGLGRGLGSQSVKIIASFFSNDSMMSMPMPSKRSTIDARSIFLPASSTTAHGDLMIRQIYNITVSQPQEIQSKSTVTNILDNLDYTKISELLQKSIDSLGCQGFGGLLLAIKALQNSGTIPNSIGGGSGDGGSGLTLPQLPDKTLNITSDGNLFQVNLSGIMDNTALIINGISLNQLTVLLSVHSKTLQFMSLEKRKADMII